MEMSEIEPFESTENEESVQEGEAGKLCVVAGIDDAEGSCGLGKGDVGEEGRRRPGLIEV